jgi:SAM-dependent methyltransferase
MDRIAPNLVEQDGGVWAARGEATLSYPEEAHNLCFDIEAGSYWFVHRNNVIIKTLCRFPPSGTIFDVGGGNGFVTSAMRDAGFPAVLVEPGRDGVRNAVKRGLRPVVNATIDQAGFVESSFPAAGLFDVVEHIQDDAAFLMRVRELLRPGGRLYLTVPALSWLWSAEDSRAGHFRRYSLESITGVLRACGFTVEYATYFFGFLVWPLFLRRSIPSRLRLRGETGDDYVDEHAPASPRVQRLLDRWSQAELARLDRDASIRRGTSCLVVCRSIR